MLTYAICRLDPGGFSLTLLREMLALLCAHYALETASFEAGGEGRAGAALLALLVQKYNILTLLRVEAEALVELALQSRCWWRGRSRWCC
jgi:hypothetical protein